MNKNRKSISCYHLKYKHGLIEVARIITLPPVCNSIPTCARSVFEKILKILRSQGVPIAYILKSLMAAILVFAHGPKSIASVL